MLNTNADFNGLSSAMLYLELKILSIQCNLLLHGWVDFHRLSLTHTHTHT